MRHLFPTLSILSILLPALAFAQAPFNDLVVYSEDGERFYLVLNGVRQNDEPETNVKVTELNQPMYRARIIFEDANLGEFNKNIYFQDAMLESVYLVKKDRKGVYTLRFQSAVPIASAVPVRGQYVVPYHTEPLPPRPVAQTQTVVTETVTTTRTVAPNQGVNVNMNLGGVGFGMNVNITDPLLNDPFFNSQATYTETVVHQQGAPVPQHYRMPGYNGPIGCPWPMDNAQFADVRRSISAQSWDETKLTTARQVIGANCLTCAQVRDLMMLMGWEQTKLELAKFAYGYTYDIGNYYQLNDAFEWESSITELSRFIGR